MTGIDKKDALRAFAASVLAFPLLWLVGWLLYLTLKAIEIILWR